MRTSSPKRGGAAALPLLLLLAAVALVAGPAAAAAASPRAVATAAARGRHLSQSAFDGMAPVTCRCAKMYQPQCGEDGVTYNNPCMRECGRVKLASEGPCLPGAGAAAAPDAGSASGGGSTSGGGGDKKQVRPGCDNPARICTANYAPICADNGETFANECMFACRPVGVEKRAEGECAPKAAAAAPPPPASPAPPPVKGAAADGQQQQQQPQKPAACACPLLFAPVCTEDGQTLPNSCVARCRGARVAQKGPCDGGRPLGAGTVFPAGGVGGQPPADKEDQQPKPQQPQQKPKDQQKPAAAGGRPACACPFIYAPVCGEDGKQYSNTCVAACEGARIARRGPCAADEPPAAGGGGGGGDKPCPCPRIFLPVCAGGKTFNNACLARCAGQESLKEGPCAEGADKGASQGGGGAAGGAGAGAGCACDRSFRQVCGRDGKTYNNMCLMQCAGVEFKSAGPCPDKAAAASGAGAAAPSLARGASGLRPAAAVPASAAAAADADDAPAAAAVVRQPSCGCTGALSGLCAAFRRAFTPALCGPATLGGQ